MKKFISLFVIVPLCLITLSACTSGPTTPPPAPTAGSFNQSGNGMSFTFHDSSTNPYNDTYKATWSGVASGSTTGGNSKSGDYTITSTVKGPGTGSVTITLINSKGTSPVLTKSFSAQGPEAVSNLSASQEDQSTSVDLSWDAPSSGPTPSEYEVSWSGSMSGHTTTTDDNITDVLNASSGQEFTFKVTSVISGFAPSKSVQTEIKVGEPWYTSPDDSSLQYQYLESNSYSCASFALNGCGKIVIRASNDCSNGIYGEVNHLDSSGAAVGYSNDTLSALNQGQMGYLEFDFTEAGSKYVVTKLHCD